MRMRASSVCVMLLTCTGAACTVNSTVVPDLTGPSTFARSLRVTATPDHLFLNGQQSTIIIEAHDEAGAPIANQRVHLDIVAGGIAATCGGLSLTEVTTGSDGRTATVFTAPTLPLPQPECSGLGDSVTIVATPIGTNFQSATESSASIRLLTPTTSSTPTSFAVNFTMSPNPAKVLQLVSFSDAGSVSPGHTITTYHWDFGDGRTKFGSVNVHDYDVPGTYQVTLTVTDDIGQAGSKKALITINP